MLQQDRTKSYKASWDLGAKLIHCPLCHNLLVKASHKVIPESRGGETDSASWWEVRWSYTAKEHGPTAGNHLWKQPTAQCRHLPQDAPYHSSSDSILTLTKEWINSGFLCWNSDCVGIYLVSALRTEKQKMVISMKKIWLRSKKRPKLRHMESQCLIPAFPEASHGCLEIPFIHKIPSLLAEPNLDWILSLVPKKSLFLK